MLSWRRQHDWQHDSWLLQAGTISARRQCKIAAMLACKESRCVLWTEPWVLDSLPHAWDSFNWALDVSSVNSLLLSSCAETFHLMSVLGGSDQAQEPI